MKIRKTLVSRFILTLSSSISICTLLLAVNIIHAQEILLSENFDDGNANDGVPIDWIEVIGSNGSWTVTPAGTYNGSTANNSSTHTISSAGDTNWGNYSFEVDITGLAGVDRHILFRYDPNRPIPVGYAVKYIENDLGFPGHIELQKAGLAVLTKDDSFKSHSGETHHMKVDLLNNNIKVYVDQTLIFDYTDAISPILTGKIGFFVEKPGFVGVNAAAYDNVLVRSLSAEAGPFELPFWYEGRLGNDPDAFKNTFWSRYTALFDHDPGKDQFTNFMGDSYTPDECETNTEACYNSHNGVDFDDVPGSDIALPVADGEIVYRSNDKKSENNDKCQNEKKGYGCVVIVKHPTDSGDIYGLYAHLKEIYVEEGDVQVDTELGKMGTTGSSTGEHLHFSSLKMLPPLGLSAFKKMGKKDWEALADQILSKSFLKGDKSLCTYKAPNGLMFQPVDPSGWQGEGTDPWSLAEPDGCGGENKLFWKYEI